MKNVSITFTPYQLEEVRFALETNIDIYEQRLEESSGSDGVEKELRSAKAALKKITEKTGA
jgi:hypothetical protein|tara:strand:+ start:854 stop:1036 length:183 start_codon:yes stop_codon:yes gene_type:complete